MRKFIRKHQKKFIALVMIILMISFAASSGNRANNRRNDDVVGRIGKASIRMSEAQQAHQEWGVLNRNVLLEQYNPYTGQPIAVPIARNLFPPDIFNSDKAADLFMLLRHEAHESGVKANGDDIETLMTNNYHRPEIGDDSMDDIAREAITDYLLIQANFNRVASDVKISQPQRDRYLSQAAQQIQLEVVELSQSDFAAKVPAPTTQQVQDQFTKFSDTTPGQPDKKNSFGFGYRLPDAVKLQYLALYREEAQKTIESSKSAYDWEVDARLYYRKHLEEYAASQPTTQALGPMPKPTTRPYAEIAQRVLNDVRKPLIDKLMFDVQGKITSTMQVDWRSYKQSGGPYPTAGYLNKLASQIHAQYGMTVYVTDLERDFLSRTDLGALPSLGHASDGRTEFSDAAMQAAAAYLKGPDKGTAAGLAQLMQPSGAFIDPNPNIGNVYIYRLTNARAAQPAPSVAEVSAKIDTDLRTEAAYALAKDAANPLLAAARAGKLSAAANAINKIVWTTSSFSNSFGEGPAYLGTEITLSESGEHDFVDQAFSLLSHYQADQDPHPVRLIEIPQDGKVYVARMAKLSPAWNSSNFFAYSIMTAARLQQEQTQKLKGGWMDYDAVVQRLGYKPENSSKDSSS